MGDRDGRSFFSLKNFRKKQDDGRRKNKRLKDCVAARRQVKFNDQTHLLDYMEVDDAEEIDLTGDVRVGSSAMVIPYHPQPGNHSVFIAQIPEHVRLDYAALRLFYEALILKRAAKIAERLTLAERDRTLEYEITQCNVEIEEAERLGINNPIIAGNGSSAGTSVVFLN